MYFMTTNETAMEEDRKGGSKKRPPPLPLSNIFYERHVASLVID